MNRRGFHPALYIRPIGGATPYAHAGDAHEGYARAHASFSDRIYAWAR